MNLDRIQDLQAQMGERLAETFITLFCTGSNLPFADFEACKQVGATPNRLKTVFGSQYEAYEARYNAEHCQCPACLIAPHASSCAVHNMPALPNGACDCKRGTSTEMGE